MRNVLVASAAAAACLFPLAALASGSVGITALSPGTTVKPGEMVSFTAEAQGFVQPFFQLSDSFASSSVTSGDINSAGQFSWTPGSVDTGVHVIDVIVTDSQGHAASIKQTVTVAGGAPNILITGLPANAVFRAGKPAVFTVAATGFHNPSFAVSDSFQNSSFTSTDIDTAGRVSWTPADSDSGTHLANITVRDDEGHDASTQVTLNIIPSGNPSPVVEPPPATVAGLAANQIQAILSLLQSFGADAATVSGVTRELQSIAAPSSASAAASVGDGYVFNDFLGLGSQGQGVRELQKRLTAFDVYSGPITGYFGALTKAAVKAFQSAHGVDAVGYVGPGTRAALNAQ